MLRIIAVAFSAIALTTSIFLWVNQPKPVVAFNTQETISMFLDQLSKSDMSDAEKSQLTDRFGVAMAQAVDEYASSHKLMIINSNTVVAGVPDSTREIQQLIQVKLRG